MSSHDIRQYLSSTSPIARLQPKPAPPPSDIHNSADLKLQRLSQQAREVPTPRNKKKHLLLRVNQQARDDPGGYLQSYS
jgi:hypothetical protein